VSDLVADASRLRQFNRFYTGRLELLDRHHLDSPFTLPEVRVMYELAHRDQPTASEVAAATGMDEGYLSRLLRGLRKQGLVRARATPHDGRKRALTLTDKGAHTYAVLDERATESMVGLIRDLSPSERQQLTSAAATIESLLDSQRTEPAPAGAEATEVELREPRPGDLGWVVQRHGELYNREYGWDVNFERLVARVVGDFAASPGSARRRCWIATLEGRRAGSIFIMPGDTEDTAKLRLLLVEPWARGHSVGTKLVEACIDAARQAGCRRLTLWTNDVLTTARRIYERAGFRLTDSAPHSIFGDSLVGQTWDLLL
jgi:DNA-binding MarR family transcriptional regulator/GNAT superfamily N-acetyltransferase